MSIEPLGKTTLLERTRAARAALDALLATLDDRQMHEPAFEGGWSAKDLLAHIANWEALCIGWIEAGERGETPDRPAAISDEEAAAINERVYREHRERPLDDVRASSRRSYERMIATIERLDDGALTDGSRFAWTGGRPVSLFIRWNADAHYDEHREQIAAWTSAKS